MSAADDVNPALEKSERRLAAKEVRDAGGRERTATTGSKRAPIPKASFPPRVPEPWRRAEKRLPKVAIVKAIAPIGTTQSVLDER
jgi:hypothetical protein